MLIRQSAQAGSLNPSDVLITVTPNADLGIKVELETKKVIMRQFGKQIEKVIKEKVQELGIKDVYIKAQDKGALDFTIKARVQAAIERAV